MTQIFIALLGAGFVLLGLLKLAGQAGIVAAFARLRLGRGPRWLVGTAEVLFGAALAASAWIAPVTAFAALPLLAIALGAVGLHLLRPPRLAGVPAAVLALGLIGAVALQPLGLRIAMLPRAEALPVALLEARVLRTYAPGAFLESVTFAPDGAALIAHTTGADFATFDLGAARGEVLRRAPDGTETTLLRLPPGSVAGVGAFGPDGAFYLTVAGAAQGLWRHDGSGDGALVLAAPDGVSWNGLTRGPDGAFYAAGDRDGAIWRLDPVAGTAEAVLRDPRLAPRRFVALAPGVNGLEFHDDRLIMTVSDSGRIWAARHDAEGAFGPLEPVAEGVPGDDLAIGPDGTIYVTTHPFNTVVAIAPEGDRRVVADASTGATGSTDLALVPHGRGLLMVTDGGLFGGLPGAAGALVELSF